MSDLTKTLKKFGPSKNFFIGIDSDGCVFDSMELKHKECFCPQYINHFGLQPVSKFAREVWDFVNLYSKTRGSNRFTALIHALDLLKNRKDVIKRKVYIPELKGARDWTARETKLSNPALKREIEKINPDPDLAMIYNWSLEVNETIKKIVRNIPPFPFVKEALKKINEKADTIVVSQTPCEAIEREWKENEIDPFIQMIAGQEMGTKTEHLSFAAKDKYLPHKILMIGDAPGDYQAAKANNALFFPIIPGHEEESWKLFFEKALDKFFNETYSGKYEENLIKRFNQLLPENPPWESSILDETRQT